MTLPNLLTFPAPPFGTGSDQTTVVEGAVELFAVGVAEVEVGAVDLVVLDVLLLGPVLLDSVVLEPAVLGSGNGATLRLVDRAAADEDGTAGNACPPIEDPHPATINAAAAVAPQLRSFIQRA